MDQEEIEKYKKLINQGGDNMVTNFERLFVELVNEKHEIRKKAEAEGRAEGRAEGLKAGKTEGRKEEKNKIVKKMLCKSIILRKIHQSN